MLELILIIWLSIGFIISLTTFFVTMYKVDYIHITLEDLFALAVATVNGPLLGIYLLIEKFIDMDDVVLYRHHRQE